MKPDAIYTIGYERAEPHTLIATLREVGVSLLLDVRAVPASRKKGFSKNQLAALLEGAGIAYRHLKGLGTPRAGRDAAHRGDRETFERIFRAHLEEPEALFDLGEAIDVAQRQAVCLLCLERDPEDCHRLIVANRMADVTGQEIKHLFPDPERV